jgi:hypothetical protein
MLLQFVPSSSLVWLLLTVLDHAAGGYTSRRVHCIPFVRSSLSSHSVPIRSVPIGHVKYFLISAIKRSTKTTNLSQKNSFRDTFRCFCRMSPFDGNTRSLPVASRCSSNRTSFTDFPKQWTFGFCNCTIRSIDR